MFSPAGGAKYRIKQQARFAEHLAYLEDHQLEDVVALALASEHSFTQEPRVGPWANVIRGDPAFAQVYPHQDRDRYRIVVSGIARLLFDRDTVPGAEPEDLLLLDTPALIVPGRDDSHATSAARYLEECLPAAQYWDMPVGQQTEETVTARLDQFLEAV